MNTKELAEALKSELGSLSCSLSGEVHLHPEQARTVIAALERCAELEADAERLDAIQRNEWDLISMIDDDEAVSWVIQETSPDGSQIASGNTAREAINAAIDALRSEPSEP